MKRGVSHGAAGSAPPSSNTGLQGIQKVDSWACLTKEVIIWQFLCLVYYFKNWDIHDMRIPQSYSPQNLSQSSPWHILSFSSSCLISRLRHVCLISQALAQPVILLVQHISNFPKGPQHLVTKSLSPGLWWLSGRTRHLQSTAYIAPSWQDPWHTALQLCYSHFSPEHSSLFGLEWYWLLSPSSYAS